MVWRNEQVQENQHIVIETNDIRAVGNERVYCDIEDVWLQLM